MANPFPTTFEHRNTATAINPTKLKHRSKLRLEDWVKANYAKRPEVMEALEMSSTVASLLGVYRSGAPEVEQCLKEARPFLLKGACEKWPAMREGRWSLESLYRRFKHAEFKIGECDAGRKIRVKYKYFHDYMKHNEDDSPLYMFESGLDYAPEHALLLKDFQVPSCFPHDWLNLCGREHKPPYRWFCVGPKRSGTTVHKDPLATNAWNAVTSGRKRWVLFEPQVAEKVATGRTVRNRGEGSEAIDYFYMHLPRIKKEYPEIRVYECMQEPGDVIFVPGGWWHGVVNLEDAVAVTQNYCGTENFDQVYVRMTRDRPGLCKRWLRNMKRWAKPLYKRTKWIDKNTEQLFPHGDTSSSDSSGSSDSSEYSSSDEEEDLDWTGLTNIPKQL